MRIVHIEDFFHPYAGYQVNILAKYMVNMGHEVSVITAELDKIPDYLAAFFGRDNIEEKDSEYTSKYGVQIIRLPVKAYVSGRVLFGSRLQKEIEKLKPDVVYVHGNDTVSGMKIIYYCSKRGIPVVSDSHMLEMASTNRYSNVFRLVYRHTVAKRINRFRIPVIRTQDDDYVNRCLGVDSALTPYIPLGSDLMIFKPDADQRSRTRKELGIDEDAFTILYAGKIDEAKGGEFLARSIKEKLNSDRKLVMLLVGTPSGNNKVEIEQLLSKSENTIVNVPTQVYVNLPKFYQAADIAVFPRQCSLSFYDVQAVGLPVVFEDNVINVKRAQFNNALTFKQGNINSFREGIEYFANLPEEEFDSYRKNAMKYISENYNYEEIVKRYLEVLSGEYEKNNAGIWHKA